MASPSSRDSFNVAVDSPRRDRAAHGRAFGSNGLFGRTTKLGDYLRASVDYESWKTGLDPSLRSLVLSSRWPIALSLLISMLLLILVSLLLGPGMQLPTLLLLIFFTANAVAAIGLVLLFWVSDGLDAPVVRRWHWVAFSVSTVADADVFVAAADLVQQFILGRLLVTKAVGFVHKDIFVLCVTARNDVVQLPQRFHSGRHAEVLKSLFPIFLQYWRADNQNPTPVQLLGKQGRDKGFA
jgi:hypothetical protein